MINVVGCARPVSYVVFSQFLNVFRCYPVLENKTVKKNHVSVSNLYIYVVHLRDIYPLDGALTI
jgi:hypothetical protein